jgi:hypothetical protein
LKPRRSTVRVFCEHCSPIAESACNLKPQDFRQVGRNPFRVGDSDLANDKLQNLIERAVILSNNGVLPNPLPTSDKNPLTVTPSQGTFNDSTRALIFQALREAGWVIGGSGGAADRLGLKRTTLIAKMKKLGISRLVRRSDMTRLPGTPVESAMAATNI